MHIQADDKTPEQIRASGEQFRDSLETLKPVISEIVQAITESRRLNMAWHGAIIATAVISYFLFAAWCLNNFAKEELVETTKTLAAVATGYLGYLAGRRA